MGNYVLFLKAVLVVSFEVAYIVDGCGRRCLESTMNTVVECSVYSTYGVAWY